MLQTKVVAKIKTHFMFNNFYFLNHTIYEIVWKNVAEAGHRWQYDTCALHDEYLRLQAHTWNM